MRNQNRTTLRIVTDDLDFASIDALPALQPAPEPTPAPAPPALTPAAAVTDEIAPITDATPGRSWSGRVFALSLLLATVAGLGYAGQQVYYVLTDAWIAPLHLSPDSDVVAQLRLQQQRNLAELGRADAEITRLDGELAAIRAAIEKLSRLRGSAQATLTWQAERSQVDAGGYTAATALLERQRGLLVQLHTRQLGLVERARADLAAGAIDRTALDREEQVRDQLALELTELDRQIAEAAISRKHNQAALVALKAGTRGGARGGAQMPEVAAGEEHTARIEVEIERLEAEARGHQALRAAAVSAAAAQRELLAELEARPLYRAMSAATDVAFVPYDQLANVKPGARVVDCVWGVFHCTTVGKVAEILPGEVVTQDPWGELARGQYAILTLDDRDAVHERVLRVRP